MLVFCEKPYDFEFVMFEDEYMQNDHEDKEVANDCKIYLGLYDICIADLFSDERDTAGVETVDCQKVDCQYINHNHLCSLAHDAKVARKQCQNFPSG